MKKLLIAAIALAASLPLIAQEEEEKEAITIISTSTREERSTESSVWPACFAICEYPSTPDLVGLRLTIPFSTKQENVTGIDLGLWGRAQYFEGFQINILRNDVRDRATGLQVGIYNSVGRSDMIGIQVGLWNEAQSLSGIQAGLMNVAGEVEGFQVGLINRCETMHGYQLGLINVIRDAELTFCPVLNIGF